MSKMKIGGMMFIHVVSATLFPLRIFFFYLHFVSPSFADFLMYILLLLLLNARRRHDFDSLLDSLCNSHLLFCFQ